MFLQSLFFYRKKNPNLSYWSEIPNAIFDFFAEELEPQDDEREQDEEGEDLEEGGVGGGDDDEDEEDGSYLYISGTFLGFRLLWLIAMSAILRFDWYWGFGTYWCVVWVSSS